MINKRAVEMSVPVPDSEKEQANIVLTKFDKTLTLLSEAREYLNIMKMPFKDNPDMSKEDVFKARAALRRFRDKAIENFNQFKIFSFSCINLLQEFGTDTQVIALMTSYISSVELLENSVNKFATLFKSLQDKDFSKNVVTAIEDVQEKCEEIKKIIEERIKIHIQTNILAATWVDAVGRDMKLKINEKTPILVDLYNKQQDILKGK